MEKYRVLSVIGKGSFGVISKIERKSDKRVFVWKEINYGQMSEREKK
jgi:NIMA (never in mitosis gene a)-related kinase 2